MLEYKYDTQLLIEGMDLDEDVINEYFEKNEENEENDQNDKIPPH